MSITLYHHPFSRAAGAVWMLEEVGVEYDLRFVNITAGEQKSPAIVALNPMGKLPIVTDGDAVVTESAAIGLYLADRYSLGSLAPKVDDPARATYLRWSLFAPSVIEPCTLAKTAGWDYKPGQAGWGTHEAMLDAMSSAIGKREFLLGDKFSMADVIFGGTLRFMLRFNMLQARPEFTTYVERLEKRPALQRSDERNQAVMKEHGIQPR
jgi:glutathione S-transferase